MSMFSDRNNLKTNDVPITIRNEAPKGFRSWLYDFISDFNIPIKDILGIVCKTTYQAAEGNWGVSYISNEVIEKIYSCKWYYVYDLVEKFYEYISKESEKQRFARGVNTYFIENGIGWKLENGMIMYRGDVIEDTAYKNTIDTLSDYEVARNELQHALANLSQRPTPDLTGTIHHSLGAMESFLGVLFNSQDSGFGAIMKKYKHMINPPLDTVIEKLWGYASNYGRHVTESKRPTLCETQFVLYTVSAIINFMEETKKDKNITL